MLNTDQVQEAGAAQEPGVGAVEASGRGASRGRTDLIATTERCKLQLAARQIKCRRE